MLIDLGLLTLIAAGALASRLIARSSHLCLLPGIALVVIGWTLDESLGGVASLDWLSAPKDAKLSVLLILLGATVSAFAVNHLNRSSVDLVAAGAMASVGAIVSPNIITHALWVGPAILLCFRSAWVNSPWQRDQSASVRVAITTFLGVLALIAAALIVYYVSNHGGLIGPAVGLIVVSTLVIGAAFPFGGIVPAMADPDARYHWNVASGYALFLLVYLTFTMVKATPLVAEGEYWPVAAAILMGALALTGLRYWADNDPVIAWDSARFAAAAFAVVAILAGDWKAWVGLVAGGLALIATTVGPLPTWGRVQPSPSPGERLLTALWIVIGAGMPGGLGFVLRWLAIQEAVSKSPWVAILIAASSLIVVVALARSFYPHLTPKSAETMEAPDPDRTWPWVVWMMVALTIGFGLQPAPLIGLILNWYLQFGVYP